MSGRERLSLRQHRTYRGLAASCFLTLNNHGNIDNRGEEETRPQNSSARRRLTLCQRNEATDLFNDTTMTYEELKDQFRPKLEQALERTAQCECGCCHAHDYGACPEFELGGNGRCVYCDHSAPCHERDKNREAFNGPLGIGFREGGL